MAKQIALTKDYSGDAETSTLDISGYRTDWPTTFTPNQRWSIAASFRGSSGIVLERFVTDDPKDEGPNKDKAKDFIGSLNTRNFSSGKDKEEVIMDFFISVFPELAGAISESGA